jgi:predicted dehydrogenase
MKVKKSNLITNFSRRKFLGAAGAISAFSIVPRHVLGEPGKPSPNDKLNIACIGCGNKGYDHVRSITNENTVALCDVDSRHAAKSFGFSPTTKKYDDYRAMLDKEKSIDAVIIATPDHHHIPAAIRAMKLGKHVYCEKPLGQNIREIRKVTELAKETKLVTQMGNATHTGMNYRGAVKMIKDGIIGEVKEAHCWCDQAWEPGNRPRGTPVPATLNWDHWIGPARMRPFNRSYHPSGWRSWWEFGNGRLGDMGCHMIDLPFAALDLKSPLTCEAISHKPAHKDSATKWLIANWEFGARGNLPPVKLTWYDGGKRPALLKEHNMPDYPEASLLVGSKGMMLVDYSHFHLYPIEKFGERARRAKVQRKPSHMQDWIEACKENDPTRPGCNFGYSGPLTETVLLGIVAYRTGEKISWDARNMRVSNNDKANRFTYRKAYREGWEI